MGSEQSLPDEAEGQGEAAPEGEAAVLRRRRKGGSRSRSRGRRRSHSQAKFSRLTRVLLWLGLPVVLWSLLYMVIRLFEH